jgi:hypothetical protein
MGALIQWLLQLTFLSINKQGDVEVEIMKTWIGNAHYQKCTTHTVKEKYKTLIIVFFHKLQILSLSLSLSHKL